MRYFLSVIFCFLTLSVVNGQSLSGDSLNLNFEKKVDSYSLNWIFNGRLFSTQIDSLSKVSGEKSLFIKVWAGQHPLNNCKVFQTIFLPQQADSLSVSISAKGEQFSGATFKVILIDSIGKVAFRDSVIFTPSSNWNDYKISTSNSLARILYLEISVTENSSIWVDNVVVKINGKNLYTCPIQQINTDSTTLNTLKNSTGLDISKTDYRTEFASLNTKKIIGIGESIHGSHEMAVWKNQIIKYLVEYQNCKLIILETANDFATHLNTYIQTDRNDKNFILTNIPAIFQFYYSEEVMDLLKWLKKYNLTAPKKVTIAGMDITGNNYVDKLKSIFVKYNTPIFNKLYQQVNSDKLHKLILENKNEIIRLSSSDIYNKIVKFAIRNLQLQEMIRSILDNKLRDRYMFEIAKELIDEHITTVEKTVICAHLDHLKKQSNSRTFSIAATSLGNYLNDYYKSKYYVIAELSGRGKYYAANNNYDLRLPFENSIEKFCMNSDKNVSFIGVDQIPKLNNTSLLCRTIGGFPDISRQFYPLNNINNNFDAILFIKDDSPLKIMTSVKNSPSGLKASTLLPITNSQPKVKPNILSYRLVSPKQPIALNGFFCLQPKDGIEFMSTTDTLYKMTVGKNPVVPIERIKSIDLKEDANNKWSFTIKLDEIGTKEFEKITKENLFNQFPLILNNQIVVAPNINSVIKDGVLCMSGLDIETIQIFKQYLKNHPIK